MIPLREYRVIPLKKNKVPIHMWLKAYLLDLIAKHLQIEVTDS